MVLEITNAVVLYTKVWNDVHEERPHLHDEDMLKEVNKRVLSLTEKEAEEILANLYLT